jgi:hypothetical protein
VQILDKEQRLAQLQAAASAAAASQAKDERGWFAGAKLNRITRLLCLQSVKLSACLRFGLCYSELMCGDHQMEQAALGVHSASSLICIRTANHGLACRSGKLCAAAVEGGRASESAAAEFRGADGHGVHTGWRCSRAAGRATTRKGAAILMMSTCARSLRSRLACMLAEFAGRHVGTGLRLEDSTYKSLPSFLTQYRQFSQASSSAGVAFCVGPPAECVGLCAGSVLRLQDVCVPQVRALWRRLYNRPCHESAWLAAAAVQQRLRQAQRAGALLLLCFS